LNKNQISIRSEDPPYSRLSSTSLDKELIAISLRM